VLAELVIASDGSAPCARSSKARRPLDEAVQKTVCHWKYRPSDDDGRPELTTKRIRFTFQLGQ
jgi:hypothetical protein